MRFSISVFGAAFLSTTVLAACGGSGPLSTAPTVIDSVSAQKPRSVQERGKPGASSGYRSLYDFGGLYNADGGWPLGSLIDLNGELYGTTDYGGVDPQSCSDYAGCGTVFRISTSGSEKMLYAFKGSPDGANPYGALAAIGKMLYSTTAVGGAGSNPAGTAFKVSLSGSEHVIYDFNSQPYDGNEPTGGLIAVKGVLYGMTTRGGRDGNGTVFEVSKSGDEKTLYSFGHAPDGAGPSGGLLYANGFLYGTTTYGGAFNSGTVFQLALSGSGYKVLYSFKGGSYDGAEPWATLIEVHGELYGTTATGAGSDCEGSFTTCGTVFEVSLSGKERILHKFTGGSTDGADPLVGVTSVNDTLYGVTAIGGGGSCSYGCGTIFEVNTSGKGYKILYSFAGGTDGENPRSKLLLLNGTLYGTTLQGGTGSGCPGIDGCGTVYVFTP